LWGAEVGQLRGCLRAGRHLGLRPNRALVLVLPLQCPSLKRRSLNFIDLHFDISWGSVERILSRNQRLDHARRRANVSLS